jgi:electron transfer flavoprotein alpha subunit
VIAVNRDPKAPIFNFADYGVVMDANSFLDGIISAVESRIRPGKTLNQ